MSKQVTESSAKLDDLRPRLSAAVEARNHVAFLLAELRANSNDARKAELEALRSRVDSVETELSRLRGLDASSERQLLLEARKRYLNAILAAWYTDSAELAELAFMQWRSLTNRTKVRQSK